MSVIWICIICGVIITENIKQLSQPPPPPLIINFIWVNILFCVHRCKNVFNVCKFMYYSEEKIKHIVNAATIIVTLKPFVLAQFMSKFIESLDYLWEDLLIHSKWRKINLEIRAIFSYNPPLYHPTCYYCMSVHNVE